MYTGYFRRNLPYFRKMFLRLNYIDLIKKHQYPQLDGFGGNGKSSIQEEEFLYIW
jgi:hypothetical protein